ncbi:MAG: hypothetical protein LBB86_10580 [Oscillospiraceae bacterium]|jgi:hypothetical protein|nr:hypothetical protein [Oscillospiraceae bacterium]
MKRLAVALLAIVILAGGAALYLRLSANLSVIGAYIEIHPAAESMAVYEDLKGKLADGSFTGDILSDADLGSPEGYEFLVYTVRLRNYGILPAEWIRIEIAPAPDWDVIAVGEPRGFSLAAFSAGTLSGTMLARAGGNHARIVTIRYYVYGRMFTIDVPVNRAV